MGEVHYLNPITFEARYFAESLNAVSRNCKVLDVHLIEALENVINTIDEFLESNPTQIVASKNTKLIKCDNLKYIKRVFYCTRCKMDLGKSSSKVAAHLADDCGINLPLVVPSSQIDVKPEVMSNLEQTFSEEEKERKTKRKQQKEEHLTKIMTLKNSARNFLSMDIIALYQQITDSIQIGNDLKSLPDYSIIENGLLDLMKPIFPNQTIKVYKFGSRESGIGLHESDLDIFIDIGNTFKTFENHASAATLSKLYKVRDTLKNHDEAWKGLVVIDKARVPILRVNHVKSNIACDINFSNCLGLVNTQLMEYIFSLQPIARLLCIYMKKWLIHTGLKSVISTYSMNLMVFFYLQQLNHLPAISKLFQNVDLETALFVGPWLGTYNPLTRSDLNIELADSSTLTTFVEGFFKFYLVFDFENRVVCPYSGIAVTKSELPTVMPNRYTIYAECNKDFAIELESPMTIQDPVQLNHNIVASVSDFALRVFKEIILKSWQIITRPKQ